MQFCEKCDNMYYIRLPAEDDSVSQAGLVYYCRKCGHEKIPDTDTSFTVLRTDIKQTATKYSQVVNEYTKYDPTLPRITTMRCPNHECKSNEEGTTISPEIIYIRYDYDNLKYIYLCGICDTVWKTM